MENKIEVTISNYKNFLRNGDLTKVADLTKAQELNKGNGYTYRYVQLVDAGKRNNPTIVEMLINVAKDNVEAGISK